MRSSMILLGICVVALLIGALRLASERTPLPTGSSYSTQPDGAMGLYAWADAVGAGSRRLQDLASSTDPPTTLIVLQPESPLDATERDAFDSVAARGGTIVLAGDSLPWLLYARGLGVTVEPLAASPSSFSTPDGLILAVSGRYRLRADGAERLLIRPDGDVLAVRLAYKQGSLVVIASPEPLTNARLSHADTARFVLREIISPSVGGTLAFDEVHHSFAPVGAGPISVNQLLFGTPGGHALIYAALLTFAYLVLSGRRLGPPLPAGSPPETHRTMYEHVQMLGSLYRRARLLASARTAFSRHYARRLARRGSGSPERSAALRRIESARTEAELIAAVAAFDDAG